jgi:glucan biosynthesis protein
LYEVVDGQTRELAYDPAMFDYGKSGVITGYYTHLEYRKLPL